VTRFALDRSRREAIERVFGGVRADSTRLTDSRFEAKNVGLHSSTENYELEFIFRASLPRGVMSFDLHLIEPHKIAREEAVEALQSKRWSIRCPASPMITSICSMNW